MLLRLVIQDFILIEKLALDLSHGLTALTGETGAGKSILLDALGLVLGGRAESSFVRHGATQSILIAEFDVPNNPEFNLLCEEAGIDPPQEILIRRIVTQEGKSRAYFNDQPVSLNWLKQIAPYLLEIHGQFDNQLLLQSKYHLKLLDQFGNLSDLTDQVGSYYRDWQQVLSAYHTAVAKAKDLEKQKQDLEYIIDELEKLGYASGEEKELEEHKNMLAQSQKIYDALDQLESALFNDHGALGHIIKSQRSLIRLSEKNFTPAEHWHNQVNVIQDMLEDLKRDITREVHALDLNPKAAEQLDNRMYDIRGICRKYQIHAEGLPDFLNQRRAEYEAALSAQDEIEALKNELDTKKAAYDLAAQDLSHKRTEISEKLDLEVMKELAPVKLEKAIFKSLLSPSTEGPDGIDTLCFMFSANPGQEIQALHKVASGGEMARLMLALKLALPRAQESTTLIFDEIDTGFGGAVADAVGERLFRLAKKQQVLVITHSPQITAWAQHHLRVEKHVKDAKTKTHVSILETAERLNELARMLSGAEITDQALAAAKKLMERKAA